MNICLWFLALSTCSCVIRAMAQEHPAIQIVNATDSVQVRWLTQQNEPSPQLLKYQIERSFDLRSWSVYGAPIRSAATNQVISRAVERTSAAVFYRLLVSSDTGLSAMAIGGESVFG